MECCAESFPPCYIRTRWQISCASGGAQNHRSSDGNDKRIYLYKIIIVRAWVMVFRRVSKNGRFFWDSTKISKCIIEIFLIKYSFLLWGENVQWEKIYWRSAASDDERAKYLYRNEFLDKSLLRCSSSRCKVATFHRTSTELVRHTKSHSLSIFFFWLTTVLYVFVTEDLGAACWERILYFAEN